MKFHGSPRRSLGVELELQVLDGRGLNLVNEALSLLDACPDRTYVKPEYIQFTVEIASKVCGDLAELHDHLLQQAAMLRDSARDMDLRVAGGGTHPFCTALGKVTPTPRYARVEQDTGYVGYTQITYALHVHVGVSDGPEAMYVMHHLRTYLPIMLALSANSPYWRGSDTGFASYRHRVLMAAHAFGLPPQLSTWREFKKLVAVSRRARIFESFSDMHWDIRPRPDYGTVEVRIMDIQPTVVENVALAALVHGLVSTIRDGTHATPITSLPFWLEQENQYRAARDGLGADLIVTPHGHTRSAYDLTAEMLDIARAPLQAEGWADYLEPARELLRDGGNSARLRRRVREGAPLRTLVEEQVTRLDTELTRRAPPGEAPHTGTPEALPR